MIIMVVVISAQVVSVMIVCMYAQVSCTYQPTFSVQLSRYPYLKLEGLKLLSNSAVQGVPGDGGVCYGFNGDYVADVDETPLGL